MKVEPEGTGLGLHSVTGSVTGRVHMSLSAPKC